MEQLNLVEKLNSLTNNSDVNSTNEYNIFKLDNANLTQLYLKLVEFLKVLETAQQAEKFLTEWPVKVAKLETEKIQLAIQSELNMLLMDSAIDPRRITGKLNQTDSGELELVYKYK